MEFISNAIKNGGNNVNHSLNFFKTLAVFGIICIHCSLINLGTGGLIINALSRFSVPIFFLISGFYSYYADNSVALNKYKSRLIKLITLFIIASFLYFAYNVFTNRYADISSLLPLLSLGNIIRYIFFNIAPFGMHLWFLLALIYCYILYYLWIDFKGKPDILYKFIPILLFLFIIMSEFCTIMGISLPSEYYRNFLFMGLPFFTLGYLIHDKEYFIINKFSNLSLIIIGIFGMLLTIVEVLFVGKQDMFIGTIIYTICIFIWCIKNPNTFNFKITDYIGGKLYISMYVLHLIVVFMILPQNLGYLGPVICFIITAIISAIINFILEELNSEVS